MGTSGSYAPRNRRRYIIKRHNAQRRFRCRLADGATDTVVSFATLRTAGADGASGRVHTVTAIQNVTIAGEALEGYPSISICRIERIIVNPAFQLEQGAGEWSSRRGDTGYLSKLREREAHAQGLAAAAVVTFSAFHRRDWTSFNLSATREDIVTLFFTENVIVTAATPYLHTITYAEGVVPAMFCAGRGM